MNPPQCPECTKYWLDEGRPVGHYLIVSRGGHIPGVHAAQEPGAAAPAQHTDDALSPAAAAWCLTCIEYWIDEGRPRDHYLIILGGGHIRGYHDVAQEPGAAAPEEHADVAPRPAAADQCPICAEYWVNEGRQMSHYLIVSRGDHIPGVHDRSSSPNQTGPEAAGTSQVPESNAAELHNVINELISQVNQLETRLSMIESIVGDRFEEPRTGFDSESSSPGSRGHE